MIDAFFRESMNEHWNDIVWNGTLFLYDKAHEYSISYVQALTQIYCAFINGLEIDAEEDIIHYFLKHIFLKI